VSVRYAKPALLARLVPGRHAVIEASAGTGKTFTLEHLVIDLILTRGIRLENILVVTFTEKATAELASRVRAKIEELLGSPKAAPPGTPDEQCWILDDAARAALRDALFGFDRANISTIHAFCQRVLTEHAFAHRRLFQERQVDERASFTRAFKDVLRRRLAVDEALKPFLRAWLAWKPSSVAGLEQLLFDCHRKQSPLTPLFDPAQLSEVLDRVAADPPAPLRPALERWRATRELPDVLGALDELDPKTPLPPALEAARVPLDAAVAQTCLPLVAERLGGQKREAGRFDFQDMLTLVAQSLDGPDGETLARQLRERYHVALIDEFQDTDAVQWRIFERIFFDAPDGTRPLVVIGDPKQAIYGFRGADVQTYLSARARIAESGGVVAPLTENFRSTDGVIRVYNAILDQTAKAPFFTGAIRYPEPVTCGRASRRLVDGEGRTPPSLKLLELVPVRGRKPRLSEIRSALAPRIAAEIRALLGAGLQLVDGEERRPVRARDIYVLTRSAAEGYEMGDALRTAGVPHAFYKQDGLFQTAEAEHVRDLLAAVDEPHRQSRRLRAWLTPFFDLSLDELQRCRELPGTHPLLQRLLDWKALAEAEDYEELFTRILEDSGLLRRLLFEDRGERELTNYLHLFELLLEQAGRTRASLKELVTQLVSLQSKQALPEGVDGNVQRLESERDAVQIMTMHKSKGLEAAVVFVYGGFWPVGSDAPLRSYHEAGERRTQIGRSRDAAVQRRITEETREEDQRLLYVALTRARAQLVLPYFPEGGWLPREGAPFAAVNAQLQRLSRSATPELRALIAVEPLTLGGDGGAGGSASSGAASDWRPPAELCAEVEPSESFRRIARGRAGFAVTSYTRMKQAQARASTEATPAQASPSPSPSIEQDEFTAERSVAPLEAPADDELPGGPSVGVFLHQLLEDAPLGSFAGRSFDAWRSLDEVKELFDRALRRHAPAIDPRHRAHAERLVHTAFTAPVSLGGARLDRGLHRASRVLRELEFLYPFPEADHPPLGAADGRPFTVERGFVKGFVDLVFEHEGLVYFADWKSDRLEAWDPDALSRHVDDHYRLQAQLYSLALVKMLGLSDERSYQERFGGMVFCFLRGMRPSLDSAAGIRFARPGWDEVRQWEARLRRGEPLDGGAP
jgi:exodeoxyribonuclease V beta subunit